MNPQTPVNDPLSVGATMADAVVEHVRLAIMDGSMDPGSWYSVHQLADRLGVSRSPVREGLLRLEEAGAIQFVRNRGFRIVPTSPADIVEIYSIRVALEVPAARRAAAHMTGSVEELDRLQTAMADAAKVGDEEAFRTADEELHSVILSSGGASRALDVVQRLRDTARLLGLSSTRSELTMQQVRTAHDAIVDAVLAGDIEAAGRSMQEHLVTTGRIILRQAIQRARISVDPDELWFSLTEGYHFTLGDHETSE